MSEQLTISGGRGRLLGELTIYAAAALKPALLNAVAAEPRLELDLSGVTELDSAGVQLLLLAKREAARTGGALQLAGHSEAVLEVINLLNISRELGDPVVLTSERGRRQ